MSMDKAMEYAKATLALEGMNVSEKQEALVLDRLNNKITEAEFIERAKKLATE